MKKRLSQWFTANKAIFLNTGSLIGSWGVTSGLGFVYWWLAAREFSPQDVGIASASISAMTLIGTFCLMGLGTLLITELPRQPEHTGSLISTALIVVCLVGGCVGFLFVLVAPSISANFSPLRATISTLLLFAFGVSLTSITLVLDQALIGLLKGGIQLWRNGLFALGKLVILFLVSRLLAGMGGIGIYATWAVGNLISLIPLAAIVVFKKQTSKISYLPRWSLLRKLGTTALQHHLLNLVLAAPTLILPIMVTIMLSARANAWFYVAWMLANFVFVVPGALTMVLHAVNAAQQATLKHRARATLSVAFVISALSIGVLLIGAKEVLGFFGSSYAAEATWALQILALGAFPLIIKNHYISICRIQDRITPALVAMTPGGLLELAGAAIGAHFAGLVGLSLGWVGAMGVESIFMLPTLYNVVFSKQPDKQQEMEMESVWLIDTALLPAVGSDYSGTEPLWLMNKTLQPPISRKQTAVKPVWLMETTRLPAVRPPAQLNGRRIVRKARLESFQPLSSPSELEPTPTTDPQLEQSFALTEHDVRTIFEDEVL